MCFAYAALHALKKGYKVYGLIDAAGDSTPDAHKYGVKRMLQAGVIPITTESPVSNGCMTGIIRRRRAGKRSIFKVWGNDRVPIIFQEG